MIESAGGAGYGSPEQRELDLVLRDVGEGFVSEQAARAHYQVAIRHENGRLVIDEHETACLGGRREP
jgi:N-methylhydantoinase B